MSDSPTLPRLTPDQLCDALSAMGIAFHRYHHEAVFTVEEAEAVEQDMPGAHIKNLFVKDKKGQFTLITALTGRRLDLVALGKHLGANGRFSFASAEQLETYLGVAPGSVTPLALVHAAPGSLRFVLDEGIFAETLVNPHPLINSQTLGLAPQDLLRALHHWGHEVLQLDLGAFEKTLP